MKIVLLFIVSIWWYDITYAQNVVVVNEALNVAYMGIVNPLTIAVEGHKVNSVIVSTENGIIVNKGNGKYDYTPAKAGKASIKVAIKKDNDVEIIGYKWFRIKEIPMPVAKLSDKRHQGYVDAQPGILAVSSNEDLKFLIVSYKITCYRNNQIIFSNNNSGNRFNVETQHGFMSWKAGDKLIFSDIHCRYPDGKVVKIEDLTIN